MSVAYDVKAALANSVKDQKPDSGRELMTIELSARAASLLDQLAEKFDGRMGLVFAEAVALLSIGVAAQKDGFHLAVVDKDGEIQTKIDLLSKG